MRNIRNLEIRKKTINFVKEVYKLSLHLPDSEKYGLQRRIHRAAVSIPSIIADGWSRSSELEFKRFQEITRGSLFELKTQVINLQELNRTKEETLVPLFERVHTEEKMVNSLIERIKANG